MKANRRKFLKIALGAAFTAGGVGLLLQSCGSSQSAGGAAAAGNCQANGTTVSVGANHGHPAPLITAAEVTQGTQQAYLVAAGIAGHSHTLTVTAASFTSLQGGTAVAIATDADATGHTHTITIGCA